jgi:hypothetical protein
MAGLVPLSPTRAGLVISIRKALFFEITHVGTALFAVIPGQAVATAYLVKLLALQE